MSIYSYEDNKSERMSKLSLRNQTGFVPVMEIRCG